MTESYFFDTDCLSSFLWVDRQDILLETCEKIILPRETYDEISHPHIFHLKNKVDILVADKKIEIVDMDVDSEEFRIYQKLTEAPEPNHKIIGSGEAASIALSKVYNGILASNNLKDIRQYLGEMHLKHTTTGDILKKALINKIITENDGNLIWKAMLAKRRKLGTESFSEYLSLEQTAASK